MTYHVSPQKFTLCLCNSTSLCNTVPGEMGGSAATPALHHTLGLAALLLGCVSF